MEGLSTEQGDDASREAGKEPHGPRMRGLNRGRLLKRVLPVAILAAAGAAVALMVATRPEIPRKPVEERVWLVSAVTAERSTVRPELRLYGEVVAAREAQLRPLVAGPVVEIGANFEDGGTVRRGELLLAIDPFEFQSAVTEAEAQLAEAKAQLREFESDLAAERKALEQDRALIELRRRDVERAQALRAKGSGTQKSLDDARVAFAQQEQQLIAREQGIARLEARIAQQVAVIQRLEVALARAERDLADTRLVAPFDAFVVEADTAMGKRVSVSDPVATLVEADTLEARFHMPDDAYGRLAAREGVVGASAIVIWRAAAHDSRFDATIERVSGRFDPASGGVEAYARIHGLDLDTFLRPGTFVEVRMPDRRFEGVTRLPDVAVHRPLGAAARQAGGGNPATVYVVVDGRLEARAVEIVGRDGADLLVTGALDEGELVVTTDFAQIGPGVKVDVR